AALAVVIGLDKLMTRPQAAPIADNVEAEPVRRGSTLRLAVSHTDKAVWDDMAKLLDGLGAGYRYQSVPMRELHDSKALDAFDVLFLTCSSEDNEDSLVASNIRRFVGNGGTLYASDWRYTLVAMAFPDMVSKRKTSEGKDQQLAADVLDAGLQDAL